MNKETILQKAKEVFFKAMMVGYAGEEANKTKTSDGYTTIEYNDGSFKVVDRYCTTPDSDFSAGTTTIFFENKPVWWMAYGGFYSPEVIFFLKVALGENYGKGNFLGGRGPMLVRQRNLVYKNEVEMSDFNFFRGRESIVDSEAKKELGFHSYFGMALI